MSTHLPPVTLDGPPHSEYSLDESVDIDQLQQIVTWTRAHNSGTEGNYKHFYCFVHGFIRCLEASVFDEFVDDRLLAKDIIEKAKKAKQFGKEGGRTVI